MIIDNSEEQQHKRAFKKLRNTLQTNLNEEKIVLEGLSEKSKHKKRPWKVQYDMYCTEMLSQGAQNKSKQIDTQLTLSKLQQQMIRQQCPNYKRAQLIFKNEVRNRSLEN